MKQRKQEISISNRYLYYYASLIKRLYGFVARRGGSNLPDQRYVGHLDEPPKLEELPPKPVITPKIRFSEDPIVDEIVLFRYRKRLLLGYCQAVFSRAGSEIAVVSEDGRRLRFHRTNLVCCTSVITPDDGAFLRTYAGSVRALSTSIDLREIWNLATESNDSLGFDDIADLYWNADVDATQWLALYFHLETGCPFFVSNRECAYTAQPAHLSEARQRALEKKQQRLEERDEFIQWMADDTGHDPDTLTRRQSEWLEQVRQYALWGRESDRASAAHALLSEICRKRKNLQRSAFELMVRKRIWSDNQNLDLLRADIPTSFSESAIHEADRLDVTGALKGRKKYRAFIFRGENLPEVAISFRRRLFGGPEIGLHVPDVSAFIAEGSDLEQEAAERMAAVPMIDQYLPLLPGRVDSDLGRFQNGEPRPALSLLWRVNRAGTLRKFEIATSAVTLHTEFVPVDADHALENSSHPVHRAVTFLIDFIAKPPAGLRSTQTDPPRLHVQIHNGDFQILPDQKTLAHRIVDELCGLASTAVGRWCADHGLPAIYETLDAIHDPYGVTGHPNPVVRRHEIDRLTPPVSFSAHPGTHQSLSVDVYSPITRPGERYTDLAMLRQITHYLRTGLSLHTADFLTEICYRMREALATIEGLVHRRLRDQLLTQWETGREFRAVVLHIKLRGILVELLDTPFKTVVYPGYDVPVGSELTLRLTGIDRWSNRAHFNVLQPELQPRT